MKKEYYTNSGMLCIWDYNSFTFITDYDSWDKELCEDKDLERNIQKGTLVPLTLGDGTFEVDIRFGKPELSDREKEYLLVPSKPYKLISNGQICISGLEDVEKDITSKVKKIILSEGEYIVKVYLIDWNQEPGALNKDGSPSNSALPDMIVYIYAKDCDVDYRTEIQTFRKEDALR